ncbi:hypothetical protein UY3_05790 [Chelonia mydas]|uniref:Uncharacterized protein n=1 Tax=Chelonia mydas TaxID=8469 RepID=M7BIG4_CHEMY|nr:hypothetical protein UY3_05790 [Chelonia mydas]
MPVASGSGLSAVGLYTVGEYGFPIYQAFSVESHQQQVHYESLKQQQQTLCSETAQKVAIVCSYLQGEQGKSLRNPDPKAPRELEDLSCVYLSLCIATHLPDLQLKINEPDSLGYRRSLPPLTVDLEETPYMAEGSSFCCSCPGLVKQKPAARFAKRRTSPWLWRRKLPLCGHFLKG